MQPSREKAFPLEFRVQYGAARKKERLEADAQTFAATERVWIELP